MATNSGKIFEQDFKSSLPDYCLSIRLPDPPQSFTQRSDTKFSHKNPCDYILYDSNHNVLMPAELKTTKYKSMSFEDVNGDNTQNKMIHKHQILGLQSFAEYDGVVAGFFFNFRDDENNIQRLYFQNIDDFVDMTRKLSKKSFNELDLIISGNAVKISGEKKRTRYRWNIDEFFKDINN